MAQPSEGTNEEHQGPVPAVVEIDHAHNEDEDESDMEDYFEEDVEDEGVEGRKKKKGRITASIAALFEPVTAEPLEESCRDLPVVAISRKDEEVFPFEVTPVTPVDKGRGSPLEVELPPVGEGIANRSNLVIPMVDIDVEAVEAKPIQEVSFRSSSLRFDDEDDGGGGFIPPASHNRDAQFISARLIREDPSADIGFRIRMVNDTHVITEVKKDGLLSKTPILSGDKLISINNKGCLGMKIEGIHQLFETAEGHVTITVQNEHGQGSLVECHVMKPTKKAKLGLNLTHHVSHRRQRSSTTRGAFIASVDPEGLLVDSLLNPGDEVLSINGSAVLDVRSAAKILRKNKSNHITILAKTKSRTAAVVTTEPDQGTRSRRFDLYGVPTRARRLRRDENNPYDSARIGCNIAAIALAVMAIATPARTGLLISARSWGFTIFTIFGIANAPWYFRAEGVRFSPLQAFCNALVLSFMAYLWFASGEELAVGWFFAFYTALLILINIPIFFPEESSDSESEEVEEMSYTGDDRGCGV